MQKKFFILALIIIAFIGLSMTDSSAEYVCGDANSDGNLNVSDAVFIINYVFIGGSPAPDPGCCDSDCPPVVTDIDHNTYFTVKINDQCWMAQNLRVTRYQNGDPIPNATSNTTWQSLTFGAYCNYNNNIDFVADYGRLYNGFAVMDSRNIAPEGWHVPTDAEWKQLEMALGMSQAEADGWGYRGTDEGGMLKEAYTEHWLSPNEGATNESGFTALPGGSRGMNGDFGLIESFGEFWCATVYESDVQSLYCRYLNYNRSEVYRAYFDKNSGLSVRCVKDQ